MFDFKNFFGNLLGSMGNQMNGGGQQQVMFPRPPIQLLPSQQAMQDVGDGVREGTQLIKRRRQIKDIDDYPSGMMHNGYAMGRYARGGKIRPDEIGLVGDGTGDIRAAEVVHVAKDGSGATVTPLVNPDDTTQAEMVAKSRSTPNPWGIVATPTTTTTVATHATPTVTSDTVPTETVDAVITTPPTHTLLGGCRHIRFSTSILIITTR